MFKWPSLIIENFYNNFQEVIKLSNKVKYYDNDGTWPKRSMNTQGCLTTTKSCKLIYPNEYI